MARKKKINKTENETEKEFVLPDLSTEETETQTDQPNVDDVEKPATEKSDAAKELEGMMNEFEKPLDESEPVIITDEKGKRGRKKKVFENQPVLVSGELIVIVLNNISSGGLSLLDSYISKNPLPIEAVSLNEKQVTQLAPLAEKAFETLQIEKDPMRAFLYTFGAMVTSNYIMMKSLQAKDPDVFKRVKK